MLLLLLAEDSGKWIVRKNDRALWPRGRRGRFLAGFLLQPSRSIYFHPALARFFKPPCRAMPLRRLKICGASMVCSLCLESFFLPVFCAALAARPRARRDALARRACFQALLSALLLYRGLQAALTSRDRGASTACPRRRRNSCIGSFARCNYRRARARPSAPRPGACAPAFVRLSANSRLGSRCGVAPAALIHISSGNFNPPLFYSLPMPSLLAALFSNRGAHFPCIAL